MGRWGGSSDEAWGLEVGGEGEVGDVRKVFQVEGGKGGGVRDGRGGDDGVLNIHTA